jgi:peptidoglycan/xylan/chitin deacetylase (PgdA/CDA1 family)
MIRPTKHYILHAKHFVFQLSYRMGFFRIMKAMNNIGKKRLTIVTYHRVTDRKIDQIEDSLSNLFVNVETFEKQILFFKNNYRITSPEGLCRYVDNGEFPSDLILITFDDGYMDFYQHAYPVLKKHGVPVTMFIVPGKIGNTGRFSFWWDEMFYYMSYMKKREINGSPCHMPVNIRDLFVQFNNDTKFMFDKIMDTCSNSEIEDILKSIRDYLGKDVDSHTELNSMLNWENMAEISELVEFGSHTMNHRNMKYLSGNELYNEIHQSKREIQEKTKKRVVAFSYPNGFYNPEIVRHVRNAGYRFGFTTDKGINDLSDLYLMKRINLWERSSSVLTKPFSEGKLGLKMVGL